MIELLFPSILSARLMKGFRGRVHITQRTDKQGRDPLGMPEIARDEGFELKQTVRVDDGIALKSLFPGYESKYGGGKNPDNDLPVYGALIYVFRARVLT